MRTEPDFKRQMQHDTVSNALKNVMPQTRLPALFFNVGAGNPQLMIFAGNPQNIFRNYRNLQQPNKLYAKSVITPQ